MSTTECFFSPNISTDEFLVPDTEIKHIVSSKRYGIGDDIELVDGKGTRAVVKITSTQPFQVEKISVIHEKKTTSLVMILALLKGDAFTRAVSMATELGVDEVIPWQAHRSIVKWGDKGEKELSKLQKLVVESSKQCRRAYFPKVHSTQTSKTLLKYLADTFTAIPDTILDAIPDVTPYDKILLDESMPENDASVLSTPKSKQVIFAIGPEGGLTNQEIAMFQNAGFISKTLGKTILRAPTAVAKTLSLLTIS